MLREPFARLSASALLDHYRSRTNVRYFAVPDADETRADKIEAVLANRFEFNGETHQFPNTIPWLSNPSADIEWHILLHKFYYAVGLGLRFGATQDPRYAEKWVELTESWIESTPVDFIAADVTGRRVQNWIYAYYYFVTNGAQTPIAPEFHRRFLHSLHEQVEYLVDNLAPARNHRTLELYAVLLASVVFPEFVEADAWREFALKEIADNVEADLLADGVQCELSTDYHHLVLRNFLCARRLAQLNDLPVPREMDDKLVAALEFSMHVHKPDGFVPSLGDGDVRDFRELLLQGYALYKREDFLYAATEGKLGAKPAMRSAGFCHSGYYIMRSGWGDNTSAYRDERYLVFDCGPLGAGNHGHLDALNIELAAFGRSLIVDPGRYTYDESGETNWRVAFRGTAFHNTVVVDDRDQTAYRPGKKKYKVSGPAPETELRSRVCVEGFDFLHGIARSHEYNVVHERVIAFVDARYWIVSDLLTSPDEHHYDLRFHLAAQAHEFTEVGRREATLCVSSPGLLLAQAERDDVEAAVDEGYVSARYGVKHPAPIVRFVRRAHSAAFHTVVYPHAAKEPSLAVRELSVWTDDGLHAGDRVHALAVQLGGSELGYTDYWFFSADGAVGPWHFAGFRFEGRYLWVRKDAFGEVQCVRASAGARLTDGGHTVVIADTGA